MPVFNKLPHLERSINSVLNQTFQNFELLLIDDASTDGSTEKIKEFSDSRIRFFRREIPGPGGYAARNLGIENAKFDWICFLDADDEWDLSYLQKVKDLIEKQKDISIIVSGYDLIFDKNRREGDDFFANDSRRIIEFSLVDYLNHSRLMWTSATTVRKQLIKDVGMFPAGKCSRGGDIDTWIRCLEKSFRNVRINESLAFYYRNAVNRVTDNKVNVPDNFCSHDTLRDLKKRTSDINLIQAIDSFCAKSIYNVASRKVKKGLPVDYSLLNEINPLYLKILYAVKLNLKKYLMFFQKS